MTLTDLSGRWHVLAVLFLIRCGMGLQFQIVPALSPLYLSAYGISVADLGLLIGLYHAPGIALAYASGRLGSRFRDKSVALAGLVLMATGGVIMLGVATWHGQLMGRILAGAGAILMNVMMSKMVTDWFAGRELATAMAVFVNSWPVGIALGLLLFPIVAKVGGLTAVTIVVTVYVLAGALALYAIYEPPPSLLVSDQTRGDSPTGLALAAIVTAGMIWGLYNGAIAMVFGFGTLMLTERGWSLAQAASLTGVTLLLIGLSVPAGGLLTDRLKRPVAVLAAGLIAFAATLFVAEQGLSPTVVFIALGLAGGIAAGPIMSLPARVLAPRTRAIGMGIFFTVFYAVQMLSPWLAGMFAKSSGTSAAAFLFGIAELLLATTLLWVFLRLQSQFDRASARSPA